MTVRCPYCKNLIGVTQGMLVEHYVRLAAKCIGSGEDTALAGQLNQACRDPGADRPDHGEAGVIELAEHQDRESRDRAAVYDAFTWWNPWVESWERVHSDGFIEPLREHP